MLVDTFCYNGEKIAAARLALLADVVDRFVIVESKHPHNPAGPVKDDYYKNINDTVFRDYAHKISWVLLEDFPSFSGAVPKKGTWVTPGAEEAWWREGFQRDVASKYVQPGDVVHCSDADELPNPEVLLHFKNNPPPKPVHLRQTLYVYSTEFMKPYDWTRAFVCTYGHGTSFTDIRCGDPKYLARDGGWHCTNFFFDEADMTRKLRSFAHVEFSGVSGDISGLLQSGKDVYGRPSEDCILAGQRSPPEALSSALARAAAIQ